MKSLNINKMLYDTLAYDDFTFMTFYLGWNELWFIKNNLLFFTFNWKHRKIA